MCDDDVCPEESAQQSVHSPGPVGDDESLGRFVYLDQHVDDETGDLKPGAFNVTDLVNRRGWSLARLEELSQDEIAAKAAEFVAKGPKRSFRGLGVAAAGDIRAIRDDANQRPLCVIDDGEENNECHCLAIRAVALRTFTEDELRVKIRPIREQLIALLSPVRLPGELNIG